MDMLYRRSSSRIEIFRTKTAKRGMNYDVQGDNLLDEWVKHQGEILLYNSFVDKVEVNTYGGLTLTVYLEVTSTVECWRFFEQDTDEMHDLIVYGSGLKIHYEGKT